MSEGKTVMMTVTGEGGTPPTLAQAAAQLGISASDLNADFGVVTIDPERNLFAVEVRADRLPAGADLEKAGGPYRGPYSNPKIAPFGPVQPPPPDRKTKP